ncbi:MAG: glycosyltransferase [Bacteroidetes bacterium]|nr:MAG: glycosyltransferase [Bacteroidota bacterium]
MNAFDPSAPVLYLAPHLRYPTRNGADILVDRTAHALSDHVPYVDLVGECEVRRYVRGTVQQRRPFGNAMRHKQTAAMRTLLQRSHFYLEKFLTPAYRAEALPLLSDPAYGTVMCSYLTTACLLLDRTAPPPAQRLAMIWTHNDEFRWFDNLRRATRNPLGKLAAAFSERWLHAFFRRHAQDFLFLHVTEEDQAGYARHYPGHPSVVVPIGVEVPPEPVPPRPPGVQAVRLLFVGALGVKMNLDALVHFARNYLPPLREHFGAALEVAVAGSTPSPAVRALCREQGWALHPDVSDDDLRRLYERTTFALLPFPYATGAKLKLLGALAHGVPFLATDAVKAQADAGRYPSLIASDPRAWIERIEAVRRDGIPAATRDALYAVARTHAWDASVRHLVSTLQAHRPHAT